LKKAKVDTLLWHTSINGFRGHMVDWWSCQQSPLTHTHDQFFSDIFWWVSTNETLHIFRTWHDSSKTSLLLSFRGVEEKKNYLHREEKERKHVDTDNTTHIYIYIFSKGAKLIGLLCQHKFFFLFFSLNSQ